MVIIFLIAEKVLCSVFLILAVKEMLSNYRNPYPVFNVQEERRIGDIMKEYKDKGIDIKTRCIEIGR